MPVRKGSRPAYDGARMAQDATSLGWLPIDLARAASVSHTAAGKFLKGIHQTPRMAKKLAAALGHEPDHYLVEQKASVA